MRVCVRAYPRIHVALLDLGGVTHRKYGGAGFAIAGLRTEVEAAVSGHTSVLGIERLDLRCQRDVLAAIERLNKAYPTAEVEVVVRRSAPQHIGLGSKTTLIMATLRAAALAKGIAADAKTLQGLSGRGGTSGIGVNAFFRGGFIIDAGHDPKSTGGFVPSGARRGFAIPPVICRTSIPLRWRFHLILAAPARFAGTREVAFFRANTPIPEREVLRTMALAYHGVAAAVLTADLTLLKAALRGLHSVGFKKRELDNQAAAVRRLLRELDLDTECAVGLSSIGPLIYAIRDAASEAAGRAVCAACEAHGARLLGVYRGRNRGSEVEG